MWMGVRVGVGVDGCEGRVGVDGCEGRGRCGWV